MPWVVFTSALLLAVLLDKYGGMPWSMVVVDGEVVGGDLGGDNTGGGLKTFTRRKETQKTFFTSVFSFQPQYGIACNDKKEEARSRSIIS